MDFDNVATAEDMSEETRRGRARHLTQQAIALAVQSRWQDAIELNQRIVELNPNDPEAYNRLGKAYTETGQIAPARESYERALQADPANLIAQRNLERLSRVSDTEAAELARRSGTRKLEPQFFVEEIGKTGVVTLQHPAAPNVLATLAAGEQVILEQQEQHLIATAMDGTYLGRIEDQLAARLTRLMTTGNEYQAGVVGVDGNTVRIIIRETVQAPQNMGRISFPARVSAEAMPRPYLREGLVRRAGDEEDEDELEIEGEGDTDDDEEDPTEFGFHEGTLDEA
ncbi:MAG TPA: tetratricopeptide repeat protein [Chloroflexota bacterium]|nr:tetratricopeptide repeat protein [Chloroflexota bacterium]